MSCCARKKEWCRSFFFFSSRRRHTRLQGDWSSDVCSSDLDLEALRKAQPPKYAFVHGVGDVDKPVNLKVSKRGSPYNLGDEVPRHFLSVLSDGSPAAFTQGSGRAELADALLRQPIAMGVIVNRIWKGHFGAGLVDSPSNFGATAERPTNPELLEFLAQFFVDRGLSIKALHREIMSSAVYQSSSDDN